MEMLTFNAEAGYLEGVVRGYRNSLLTASSYSSLSQCETLDDLKMQLSATDYGNFLANEQPPLTTAVIAEKATGKLVAEFRYLRDNASGDLAKFLDYLTYSYMIDNLILLITGTLHERDTHELLDRCHPLGTFEGMPALCVATTVDELYNTVVVETPLAPYFRDCLSASDLDDLNIEIIRNSLYKAYLEDFHAFCLSLGGTTATVMSKLLSFEADRRTLNITLNSFGTSLTKEQRAKLFPAMGRLYPEGNNALARADDVEQVKAVCDMIPEYRGWWRDGGLGGGAGGDDNSDVEELEGKMFREETRLNRIETITQFNYSPFYAWLKVRRGALVPLIVVAAADHRALSNILPLLSPPRSSRNKRFAASPGSQSALPRAPGIASPTLCTCSGGVGGVGGVGPVREA